MTVPAVAAPYARRRRRSSRARWIGRLALVVLGAIVLTGVLIGVLTVVRYLPALDDARELRVVLERAADRAATAGLNLTSADLSAVQGDLEIADQRHARLADLLHGDPVVAIARLLPTVGREVEGADDLVAATGDLLAAADRAIAMADRYVAIRERHEVGREGGSTLAGLTELMASSRADADEVLARMNSAVGRLEAIPAGLAGPIDRARTIALEKLLEYRPILAAYARIDDVLPDVLGWSGPRRYLVLAQNPAELRPSGGFIGTVGIVVFEDGRLASKHFQDVFNLDLKPGLPFVEPPAPLRDHLLGSQSWRLADANWSPHFPTAAQDARELYRVESGDDQVTGVIALTTYAIDELLKVTGPIEVPEFGVTVEPGETTLRALEKTRRPATPGADRKAFLDVFADDLLERLFELSPRRWTDLLPRLETIGAEHSALVWLADAAEQELVVEAGWDGSVRLDDSDFVYAVDSNVAPATKLNLVTDRALDLRVTIDAVGNAHSDLGVTWVNGVERDTEEARVFRSVQTSRVLGVFFRLLVPDRSRLERVSGGGIVPLTNAELIGQEAGRTVFANYLMVPPGRAGLEYRWVAPYVAVQDGRIWTYRLVVQRQPGTRAERLRVTIAVPPGMAIVDRSPELNGDASTAEITTELTQDLEVYLTYEPAASAGRFGAHTYTSWFQTERR